ncbi:uncharacterized protein BDW43DRAFT_289637 [Aspergillus alliaceus]|uniref:uncharacterized protein n=1 Tax=Petromyces alliaceus TaxID=209559 RepID=UPI0012A64A6F|nr:uncharacterized protein BDW43DRAFT_289637 [Aspergillus alliaceus]KAB8229028.1 hypothetical protein BDW43DRAFT_289637 [Aspergillus alliaceus]
MHQILTQLLVLSRCRPLRPFSDSSVGAVFDHLESWNGQALMNQWTLRVLGAQHTYSGRIGNIMVGLMDCHKYALGNPWVENE